MAITVQQESAYNKRGWWDWSVWLEGTGEELDEVESVTYLLHETFDNPERVVSDRGSKFRLSEQALGEFMLHLSVRKKGGEVSALEHWVRLLPQAGGGGGSAGGFGGSRGGGQSESPTVFISGSVAELPLVRELADVLKASGVKVLVPGEDEPGLSWDVSLNTLLDRADHAVFILSERPSKWIEREIDAAMTRKMPVLPVILISDGKAKLPPQLSDQHALRIKAPSADFDSDSELVLAELNGIADRIREML